MSITNKHLSISNFFSMSSDPPDRMGEKYVWKMSPLMAGCVLVGTSVCILIPAVCSFFYHFYRNKYPEEDETQEPQTLILFPKSVKIIDEIRNNIIKSNNLALSDVYSCSPNSSLSKRHMSISVCNCQDNFSMDGLYPDTEKGVDKMFSQRCNNKAKKLTFSSTEADLYSLQDDGSPLSSPSSDSDGSSLHLTPPPLHLNSSLHLNPQFPHCDESHHLELGNDNNLQSDVEKGRNRRMGVKKCMSYPLLPDLLFYTLSSRETGDFGQVRVGGGGGQGRRLGTRFTDGTGSLQGNESGGENGERNSNSSSFLHSSQEDLALTVFQFK